MYVFGRSTEIWSQRAYLKPSNPDLGDNFGIYLAMAADANTIAVAGLYEDGAASGIDVDQADQTAPNAGAMYVFMGAIDAWSQRAYVKAPNTGKEDNLGSSIALSGDGLTLAVSAFHEDSAAVGISSDQNNDTAQNAGAVYLY